MALDLAAELARIELRQAELAQLLGRSASWQLLPIDMEAELSRIDHSRAELVLPQAGPDPDIWSDRHAVGIPLVCCTVGAVVMFGAGMITARYLPGSEPAWGLIAAGFAVSALLLGQRS